tara:strand:- start:520 stop:804 length:285 start_codon:yes stop_codon:yes gene_type:complete
MGCTTSSKLFNSLYIVGNGDYLFIITKKKKSFNLVLHQKDISVDLGLFNKKELYEKMSSYLPKYNEKIQYSYDEEELRYTRNRRDMVFVLINEL